MLIENVRIIDPTQEPIEARTGYVQIENGLITHVGETRPGIAGSFIIIDGSDKYLIPGLIDSHTHLANVAGLNGGLKRKHPEFAEEYFRQLPKSYLYFGYTTVVDTNRHSPRILEQIQNAPVKPHILTCGEQLEVMNGFMMAENSQN